MLLLLTMIPGLGRRFCDGAVLLAVMMALAACTGASVLTDSNPAEQTGKPVPPVSFQQVTGLPPTKLSEMKAAMATAGGQRDIGIVEGQFQSGSFTLAGEFRIFSESAGVRIVYQWQLRDTDGVLVQTIDGEDNAGLATGSDPWASVSSAVIERVARRTIEAMAAKLSELGYATRLSTLKTPPSEYFAWAGPDAHREIDFETLNGPGMAMAGADFLTLPDDRAVVAGGTPDGATASPTPQAKAGSARESPAKDNPSVAKKDGRVGIRAVAVVPVKGSPGGGDAELTAAMRKTLKAAGWPVVNDRQSDALTVVGHVEFAAKGKATQTVMVRWDVQSPDGKSLGDVKQKNDIPSGALDHGWGRAAFAVAEAAATGIFDIVNRLK